MPRTQRRHGSGSEKIRKLSKTGRYSYYITMPKSFIDRLGWRERQLVTVEMEDDHLIIRDWKKN
ncbi:AbrB/MazE/SpoVT family DNA-binding domain-containing protein [bacterium]|nr:AbrB/MazE/SpoVT family DNA-binding domain-containing protein [bacterium]